MPLATWLDAQGVRMVRGCKVTDLDYEVKDGLLQVTGIHCLSKSTAHEIAVPEGGLVFIQNGSMTDASSLGSMSGAPAKRTKAASGSWDLWEKLAKGRPGWSIRCGRPRWRFTSCWAWSARFRR